MGTGHTFCTSVVPCATASRDFCCVVRCTVSKDLQQDSVICPERASICGAAAVANFAYKCPSPDSSLICSSQQHQPSNISCDPACNKGKRFQFPPCVHSPPLASCISLFCLFCTYTFIRYTVPCTCQHIKGLHKPVLHPSRLDSPWQLCASLANILALSGLAKDFDYCTVVLFVQGRQNNG